MAAKQSMSETAIKQSIYNKQIKALLNKAGYYNVTKLSDTLQGTVWRVSKGSLDSLESVDVNLSSPNSPKSPNSPVTPSSKSESQLSYKQASASTSPSTTVIKVTNKYLHQKGIGVINDTIYHVQEDILKEGKILNILTSPQNAPKTIVKYHSFFKSKHDYFLEMEDGGTTSLFDFCVKVHQLIQKGHIEISEWHRVVKIIFKQMVDCLEYIHSKNIAHFDISLENWIINDVKVEYEENDNKNKKNKMRFVTDDIEIKICDFGLSELFSNSKTKNAFKTRKYCGKPTYKSPECTSKRVLFDAKANDIWCLGICLFMLIIGSPPCNKADKSDRLFIQIISGNLLYLLGTWDKLKYINADIMLLFQSFFQYEQTRITINKIKNHSYYKNASV
mmetsp:Transcript_61725/g.55717  ORF Transcript_61725/g.55717 Transcript_61725/m.55717 type:complete len:390 (-) Transcript_61725:396-1565(-)